MTINMKNCVAQGDMLIRRIDKLPEGVTACDAENGKYILAHSETGHHHVVKQQPNVKLYSNDNDPFIAYLVADNTKCLVEHERGFDTHETIEIPDGIFEIRRQREYTPEGFRRAQD